MINNSDAVLVPRATDQLMASPWSKHSAVPSVWACG